MAILNKKVQYRQLHCLYSKRTGDQLGPLKVNDPDLNSFLAKADQSQYGVATVNFKIIAGVWHLSSKTPETLNFKPQFLTKLQRQVLLP